VRGIPHLIGDRYLPISIKILFKLNIKNIKLTSTLIGLINKPNLGIPVKNV